MLDVKSEELNESFIAAFRKGDLKKAELFLINGADINIASFPGDETPLYDAASHNNIPAIELLFKFKGRLHLDTTNRRGETALHAAAYGSFSEIIKMLTDAGAPANYTDISGELPLHTYLKNRKPIDISTLKLLLSATEDLNVRTGDDQHSEIYNATPLYLATLRKNNKELVEEIIKTGRVDPNITDMNGFTPLHICASNDSIDAALLLLKNGAKVNTISNEQYVDEDHLAQDNNLTPLHIAAQNRNLEFITLLANHGADENIITKEGKTARELYAGWSYGASRNEMLTKYDNAIRLGKEKRKHNIEGEEQPEEIKDESSKYKKTKYQHLSATYIAPSAEKPLVSINGNVLKDDVSKVITEQKRDRERSVISK